MMCGLLRHRCLLAAIVLLPWIVAAGCTPELPEAQPPDAALTTTITAGPDNLTTESTATFEFLCNRDAGCEFECSLDDDELEPCSSPITYDDLEGGDRTFTVVSTDVFDHRSNPDTWEWTVDDAVPEVVDLKGPPSTTHDTEAIFRFDCSKEHCQFECRLQGQSYQSCYSGVSYTDLDDGTHTFSVRATDTLGNTGPEESYQWTVDTAAPVIVGLEGPPSLIQQRHAELDFGCSQDGCSYECSLNGEEYEACAPPTIYTDLDDGDYLFAVRPINESGITGVTDTLEWTVDTAEPAATIGVTPDDPTSDTSALFGLGCSKDDCEFTCELTAANQGVVEPAHNCTNGVEYSNLDDDDYTFTVFAADAFGTEGPDDTFSWTVDTVEPTVEHLEGPDDITTETAAEFDFDCSKTDCQFTCQLSGDRQGVIEPSHDCTSGVEYTDLDDDSYTFSVFATDPAGNTGEASTWSWAQDTVPPEIENLVGPDDPTNDASPQFTFDCSKVGCSFTCQLTGDDQGEVQAPHDCTSGIQYTDLSDDDYIFSVYASDPAGNEGMQTSWAFTLDTELPIIDVYQAPPSETKLVSMGAGFECTNRPDCTFQCALDFTDESGNLDEGSWSSCSSPYEMELLEPGDYELHLWATDSIGNEATETVEWTVESVDLTAGGAGGDFSCAIDDDQALWCWGDNSDGQLGTGGTLATYYDRQPADDDDDQWSQLAPGNDYVCGIRDDSTLWCWGHNDYAALGHGNTDPDYDVPTQTGTDADWDTVATAKFHTCGIRHDDTLWCWGGASSDWGTNNYGQLGTGDSSAHVSPTQIGTEPWDDIAAGHYHSCGIGDDSTLWCWGGGLSSHNYGQLGVGDYDEYDEPEQVGIETDWTALTAGAHHTCGIRNDASLWCWGRNNSGQLGLGSTTSHDEPQQVGNDYNWDSVAAGSQHTCGLRDDGSLWCWGRNDRGQLGQGTTSIQLTSPQQVGSEDDWTSVSPGGDHTCGNRDDTFWCWGDNDDGQLGLGNTDSEVDPTEVP